MIALPPVAAHGAKDSPWRHVDPRVRVAFVAASSAIALASSSAGEFSLVLVATAASYSLSGTAASTAWRGFRPFVLLIALTAVLQLFFTGGVPLLGEGFPVVSRLTREGVAAALLILARLSAVILMSTLLVATTSPHEISRSLAWFLSPLSRLGLPVGDYMLIMNMAFQFFPVLAEETNNVRMALESRGVSLRHRKAVQRLRATSAWMLAVLSSVLERSHRTAAALHVKDGGRGRGLRFRFPPWSRESSRAVFIALCAFAAWIAVP